MKTKWVIGIDEAGRGPLAGPVAVGLVLVPNNFNWKLIPGVNDSKKLSEKKREEIFNRAQILQKEGKLLYTVEMSSAKAIDKRGIAIVIRESIDKGLKTLIAQSEYSRHHTPIDWGMVDVKLDGSLKAPVYCVHQETIIKGDSKEKAIGLASIMAKVTRDRYMTKIASKPEFFNYNFARHKGYGTKLHREVIAKIGLSKEHRASYCKNIIVC